MLLFSLTFILKKESGALINLQVKDIGWEQHEVDGIFLHKASMEEEYHFLWHSVQVSLQWS